ncbi:putative phosphatidate phosphatase [Chironomus tepperi]
MICSRRILFKISFDVIAILTPVCFALFLQNYVQPVQRGFFCNDHSIMYPQKKDTVPSNAMDMCGILGGILLIIVVETLFNKSESTYNVNSRPVKLWNWTVKPYIQNLYHYITMYLFAQAVIRFLEEGIKAVVGRLRPNFMDICKPMLSDGTNCSNTKNFDKYIQDYTCSNANATPGDLRYIRVSFVSGHTSFSFMTAFFLVFYLESRMKCRQSTQMLKNFLQLSLITTAIYISSTRLSDFKHHFSDVFAGMVLGCFIAYFVCFHMSNMFKKEVLETKSHV